MITVEKGVSMKDENKEVLFISFKYDAEVVAKVKSIPGRFYHPHMKAWEVPLSRVPVLIDLFGESNIIFDEDIDLEYRPEDNLQASFQQELELFEDPYFRRAAEVLLEKAPPYFFEVPASSSGKYHPKYALGDGGLIRHTKAAMTIAASLFNNKTICPEEDFGPFGQDIVLLALLGHDLIKQGIDGKSSTVAEHPLLAAEFLADVCEEEGVLEESEVDLVSDLIRSHMGQWNTDYQGKEILPLPKTPLEKFVHLCDYLASKKFLEIPFDEASNIIFR